MSKKNPHIENLKRLVPARLRKQVETGLDMVQSTLDCHREWEDFVQGLNFDKRLRENCHRLDIGLRDKPPKLDSVDSMYQLRYEVDRYLTSGVYPYQQTGRHVTPGGAVAVHDPPYLNVQYKNVKEHIRAVSRRLVASLFYLSISLPEEMASRRYTTHIHCRLTPLTEGASSLLASGLVFRLREFVPPDSEIINAVEFVNPQQPFEPTSVSSLVNFTVSGGTYKRYVEVQIPTRGQVWEPIGGF